MSNTDPATSRAERRRAVQERLAAKRKANKRLMIIIIVAAILIGVGIEAYILLTAESDPATSPEEETTSQDETGEPQGTSASATLPVPGQTSSESFILIAVETSRKGDPMVRFRLKDQATQANDADAWSDAVPLPVACATVANIVTMSRSASLAIRATKDASVESLHHTMAAMWDVHMRAQRIILQLPKPDRGWFNYVLRYPPFTERELPVGPTLEVSTIPGAAHRPLSQVRVDAGAGIRGASYLDIDYPAQSDSAAFAATVAAWRSPGREPRLMLNLRHEPADVPARALGEIIAATFDTVGPCPVGLHAPDLPSGGVDALIGDAERARIQISLLRGTSTEPLIHQVTPASRTYVTDTTRDLVPWSVHVAPAGTRSAISDSLPATINGMAYAVFVVEVAVVEDEIAARTLRDQTKLAEGNGGDAWSLWTNPGNVLRTVVEFALRRADVPIVLRIGDGVLPGDLLPMMDLMRHWASAPDAIGTSGALFFQFASQEGTETILNHWGHLPTGGPLARNAREWSYLTVQVGIDADGPLFSDEFGFTLGLPEGTTPAEGLPGLLDRMSAEDQQGLRSVLVQGPDRMPIVDAAVPVLQVIRDRTALQRAGLGVPSAGSPWRSVPTSKRGDANSLRPELVRATGDPDTTPLWLPFVNDLEDPTPPAIPGED